MQLVEDVLRSLNGSGHQLRVEHHVQRVVTEVALRFLVAAIDLDCVAERLEDVE